MKITKEGYLFGMGMAVVAAAVSSFLTAGEMRQDAKLERYIRSQNAFRRTDECSEAISRLESAGAGVSDRVKRDRARYAELICIQSDEVRSSE